MSKEHWADRADDRRARIFRARALDRVLKHHGLSVDAWAPGVYVLRDRKGGTALVGDLSALWIEAERLAGSPLDPLDPALLASLAS